MEKDCLCEGLASSVLIKNKIPVPHNLTAVSVCPGPNLAYFSGVYTLREMIDHIYGRISILNKQDRPSMFVKELMLYTDYLKKEISSTFSVPGTKQKAAFEEFKANLLTGIDYYMTLLPKMKHETEDYIAQMRTDFFTLRDQVMAAAFRVMEGEVVLSKV
jgi:hypothetical protein